MEEYPVNTVNNTHLKSIGYVLWIFGFTGSHRFYYGRPVSGTVCVPGRESSQRPCVSSGGSMRLTIIVPRRFGLIWNFQDFQTFQP